MIPDLSAWRSTHQDLPEIQNYHFFYQFIVLVLILILLSQNFFTIIFEIHC